MRIEYMLTKRAWWFGKKRWVAHGVCMYCKEPVDTGWYPHQLTQYTICPVCRNRAT